MITNVDDGGLRGPDGQLIGKHAVAKAAARTARDAMRVYLQASGVGYGRFSGALVVICEGSDLSVNVVGRGADAIEADAGQVACTLWRALVGLAEKVLDHDDGIACRATLSNGATVGVLQDDVAELTALGKGGAEQQELGEWLAGKGVAVPQPPGLAGLSTFMSACVAALVEQGVERPPGIDAAARGVAALVSRAHAKTAEQKADAAPVKLRAVEDAPEPPGA